MGNFGPNMHLEAVGLQKACDNHLLDQINKQADRMDRNSEYLHQLSKMIIEMQSKHGENYNDSVDLEEMGTTLAEFKTMWEALREDWPTLDECPFDEELDLSNIEAQKLDEIERKIDNVRTRIQNKYPSLMLAVETATNLHKLLTDIMVQISKSLAESGRIMSRNQKSAG